MEIMKQCNSEGSDQPISNFRSNYDELERADWKILMFVTERGQNG